MATTPPAMSTLPPVSAVMPVRDDAQALPAAVASLLTQRYDGALELIMGVGPSADETEAVAAALAREDDRVTVVPNPSGGTAAGLNAALAAANGEVIVRIDAHCELPPDYVSTAVATLQRTNAGNVGGIQQAAGATGYEQAVAAAMTSRFGVGDAKFHYGGAEGPVDTVYLGVFRAAALREVGGFDETLRRNQDYELNWRLREAGQLVWFDPDLVVRYQPRSTLRGLASQYFQYGQWKQEMLRRHPTSLRARQVVAPLTVIGVAAGLAGVATGRRWMGTAPAVYATAVTVAAAAAGRSMPERLRLLHVFPTMHLSWGLGFLRGAPAQRPEGAPSADAEGPDWRGSD